MIGIAPMKDGGFGLVDLKTGETIPGQVKANFDHFEPGMYRPRFNVSFEVDWNNLGRGIPIALVDEDSKAYVIKTDKGN